MEMLFYKPQITLMRSGYKILIIYDLHQIQLELLIKIIDD